MHDKDVKALTAKPLTVKALTVKALSATAKQIIYVGFYEAIGY